MSFLLISGLGPFRAHSEYLAGTPLGRDYAQNVELQQLYARLAGQPIDLRQLRCTTTNGSTQPLLRSRDQREPCLSTVTMRSILDCHGVDYDALDIEDLWYEGVEPPRSHYDIIGLSTTYLCRGKHLRHVIRWIRDRFPTATLVVGGQFSNLKYSTIMRTLDVDYIIRGDAEAALPMLLRALEGRGDLDRVPNLVARGTDGGPHMNTFEYIDIEAEPSPSFRGTHHTVPYESMRGCPFTCKYCSFPAASPKWRFKSAEKIVRDWTSYAEQNGTKLIAALDSTFTIPPARLRRLLQLLPQARVPWYSFSRADMIDSKALVAQLEEAHCAGLAIGFESMNDTTLLAMDKKVTADENRRAVELLDDSRILVNGSFIVGYPGETPDAFEDTRAFIVRELRGRFSLSIFSVIDETMPVWADAAKYQLEETDDGWKHCGMDYATAAQLLARTVQDVRWKSDNAVMITWQVDYATPLVPGLNLKANRRIEKLVERLTFLARDWGTDESAPARARAIVAELDQLGVRMASEPATAA